MTHLSNKVEQTLHLVFRTTCKPHPKVNPTVVPGGWLSFDCCATKRLLGSNESKVSFVLVTCDLQLCTDPYGAKRSCTINLLIFLTSARTVSIRERSGLFSGMDFNFTNDEMEINMTDFGDNISNATNESTSVINESLYLGFNTAANFGSFAVIALPATIVCVLIMIAMTIAKDLNWPIRVLLLNIFVGETLELIAVMIRNLTFPVRALNLRFSVYSCNVSIFFGIFATLQKHYGIAFYSIAVYIFIVYGVRGLKLCCLAPFMVVSWLISVAVAIRPLFGLYGTYLVHGICIDNPHLPAYQFGIAISAAHLVILPFVIFLFSLFTCCYVRKNVLEENVEIKQAVAKNLYYLALATAVTIVVPVAFVIITYVVDQVGSEKAALFAIVLDQVFQLVIMVPSSIVIVSALISLKPLRLAMKQLLTAAGFHCFEDENTE